MDGPTTRVSYRNLMWRGQEEVGHCATSASSLDRAKTLSGAEVRNLISLRPRLLSPQPNLQSDLAMPL